MGRKQRNTAPENAAAIYARFSSTNQRSESIDAQVRASKVYAQNLGLDIVSIYADAAKSGKTADREEFQQMVADGKAGVYKHLIVHKLDRFSRDQYDSMFYKRLLRSHGIQIHSATEKLDDSPEGRFMESIIENMAEFYSRNLAREVKKGMFETARQGKHLGGIPPLGYDVDSQTKQYVVNEQEAALVRQIFRKYADGAGYGRILAYLNSMGFRTKRGDCFGRNSLYSILRNEKYVGRYIFNRMREKDAAGKRNPEERPREEWIILEDAIPAIIDEETFAAAQRKLLENSKRGGAYKARRPYLLTGLIECGVCGSSMCGNTRKTGGRSTYYSSYRCSRKDNHCTCNNREVNKEYIENYVLDELYRNLLSETSIRELASMLHAYNMEKASSSNVELENAQKSLREATGKINNVVRLVSESGVSIDTVKDELKRLEEKKHFLEEYIRETEVTCKGAATITEEMILDLVQISAEYVKTKNIPECRNFIQSYIEKVIVDADYIRILFKIGVPDDTLKAIVPLQSETEIETVRREYQKIA